MHTDWTVPPAAPGAEPYGEALRARLRAALESKPADYEPRSAHLHADGSPIYTNRLILESSPYLLQHAHNPVDWYPWGDEAFEAARRLGRPVLLSIGYSTCHWCHVMERESFEDVEIATFINEHFIAIKVDREERPDVDSVYMEAVQALSGRGGWPMTTVLTPDREVFFGGTYFPARDGDRGARIGFLTILKRLAAQYSQKPAETLQQAAELTRHLQKAAAARPPGGAPSTGALDATYATLAAAFDPVHGGFGRAPKFPRSVTLEFLMRYYRRTSDPRALAMVTRTLDAMAAGGMYDQLGGGFHRYSTDERWLVPHFEKMLYDNALLVVAYLEAYQITGRSEFATVARETLDYVAREMTAAGGAFYSATDADSATPTGEEEEGWYFTWTPSELEALLGSENAALISGYWGVSEQGNFEGRSILYRARPLAEVAAELGMEPARASEALAVARREMYAARQERPAPHEDTKVLTAWNGLMISAFARAALVLGSDEDARRAAAAASFVLENLRTPDGHLLRSWKDGSARHAAVLDDYAFFVAGLLDLFEATGQPRWLEEAVVLSKRMIDEFTDAKNGGFFLTAAGSEQLLIREKPEYDGAVPSGNSVAILDLLRLQEFTGDDHYRTLAEKALRTFSEAISQRGVAVPKMLVAADFYLDRPKEIVIVAPHDRSEAQPFLQRLAGVYVPNGILAVTVEGGAIETLARTMPLVEGKVARGGRTTAYVCERGVCDLPTDDPETFAAQLRKAVPDSARRD